jgi:hypothetical protein
MEATDQKKKTLVKANALNAIEQEKSFFMVYINKWDKDNPEHVEIAVVQGVFMDTHEDTQRVGLHLHMGVLDAVDDKISGKAKMAHMMKTLDKFKGAFGGKCNCPKCQERRKSEGPEAPKPPETPQPPDFPED